MNLLEVVDKLESTKVSSVPFTFAGASFDFRCLEMEELLAVKPLIDRLKRVRPKEGEKTDELDTDRLEEMYAALSEMASKLCAINPIVGWDNLTLGLVEDLSGRITDFPREMISEPIDFDANAAKRLVSLISKNVEFGQFVSQSAILATEQKLAQKKISSTSTLTESPVESSS